MSSQRTDLPVNEVICGDCLDIMRGWPDNSVDCCVTSPPYWGLRDYGVDGQLGLERTPQEYIARMVAVFEEVRRVLKPTGTLWLNVGDSYNAYNGGAGPGSKLSRTQSEQRPSLPTGFGLQCKALKPKDLIGVPWRLALALQDAGWWLRSDIIWAKPNPMPESVTDRPTSAHEHIFLLAKSERYYYDAAAIAEPVTQSSLERLGQPNRTRVKCEDCGHECEQSETRWDGGCPKCDGDMVDLQGSDRANGGAKINGPMKAVCFGGTKGGGEHGNADRTYSGNAWNPRLKGNRKTFRGGGVYTGGASFDNSADKPNDSIGNEPNPTLTRNSRNVWEIATRPFKQAHFATFPPELPRRCILAGCPMGGVVLDPFFGSGTVGMVAQQLARQFIGIELNPEYCAIARKRTAQKGLPLE